MIVEISKAEKVTGVFYFPLEYAIDKMEELGYESGSVRKKIDNKDRYFISFYKQSKDIMIYLYPDFSCLKVKSYVNPILITYEELDVIKQIVSRIHYYKLTKEGKLE